MAACARRMKTVSSHFKRNVAHNVEINCTVCQHSGVVAMLRRVCGPCNKLKVT